MGKNDWKEASKESIRGKNYFGSDSRGGTDASTALANKHGLAVDIYSPTAGVRVAFKAFLSAFNDNFDTQLETVYHIGHPQPTRRQKSVDRSMGIGIDIPSYSVEEAKLNLRNISLFTKMLYPVAKQVSTTLPDVPVQTQVLTGGDPIFKVRFMNLIVDGTQTTLSDSSTSFASAMESGLMGYIDALKYEFDLEQGFLTDWGSAAGRGRETQFDNFAYPKLIKLSFTFYPLMEQAPVWLIGKNGERTFTNGSFPYAYKGALGSGEGVENSFAGKGNLTNKAINAADRARLERALGSKG